MTPEVVYYSSRGLPLIYSGHTRVKSRVLTVEAYIKWYDLWVVSPAGVVRKLRHKWAEEYESADPGGVAWSDHKPTPGFCHYLEADCGFEWDPVALETIVGRWHLEAGETAGAAWSW